MGHVAFNGITRLSSNQNTMFKSIFDGRLTEAVTCTWLVIVVVALFKRSIKEQCNFMSLHVLHGCLQQFNACSKLHSTYQAISFFSGIFCKHECTYSMPTYALMYSLYNVFTISGLNGNKVTTWFISTCQ